MKDVTATQSPAPKTVGVPDGYMVNAKGNLIALANVKEIDKLRDEQVKKMVKTAKELQADMLDKKGKLFDDFNQFVDLSANEYDTHLGGKKGNVTLLSFDGKQKVQLAVNENISFDERLQVAKQLIDECIHEWSEGSNDNIKTLVNQAFSVDKEGNISTYRVLGLRRLNFDDGKWVRAMQAIADSVQVTDSKEYIRFYQKNNDGKFEQISLDFASI